MIVTTAAVIKGMGTRDAIATSVISCFVCLSTERSRGRPRPTNAVTPKEFPASPAKTRGGRLEQPIGS